MDNSGDNPAQRADLVLGGRTISDISDIVCEIPEKQNINRNWWIAFIIAVHGVALLGGCIAYLFWEGVGIWGNMNPVYWGWPIVNFVFWVGIGHAGTLISAVLFLFRQKWRTSINRFAEAMTVFAVICAAIFPGVHIGRPWLAYWLFPVPNSMVMWPNFRSPLLWDVFAVGTYATISALFFGTLASFLTSQPFVTEQPRMSVNSSTGIFSLGWTGSARHWHRYERAYLILAGLATPLVLSVHSVVSFDFAVSQVPGWHTTIFPPYFVAGAIFSGFAMVVTLSVPAREWFGFKELITVRHLENMNKIILVTGTMVGYAYAMEFFVAWYSGNLVEKFAFINRATGPYWWAYWTMVSCNVISTDLLVQEATNQRVGHVDCIDLRKHRHVVRAFRYHHHLVEPDFLPASWGYFTPTIWDGLMFLGSFGLFFTLFLLFIRWIPQVAIAEVKATMPEAHVGHHGDHH